MSEIDRFVKVVRAVFSTSATLISVNSTAIEDPIVPSVSCEEKLPLYSKLSRQKEMRDQTV